MYDPNKDWAKGFNGPGPSSNHEIFTPAWVGARQREINQQYAPQTTQPATSHGHGPINNLAPSFVPGVYGAGNWVAPRQKPSRLPGLFRTEWWFTKTPLYALAVAGEWLSETRYIQVIVGVLAGILSLVLMLRDHSPTWDNKILDYLFIAAMVGVSAFVATMLFGKVLFWTSYIMAFLFAWGLVALSTAAIASAVFFCVALATSHTDVFIAFYRSCYLSISPALHGVL